MTPETLIGTLIVLALMAAALYRYSRHLKSSLAQELELRARERQLHEALTAHSAATLDLLKQMHERVEARIEAPSNAPEKTPERLEFEASVQRMLARCRVETLDRDRFAGEIEHHWARYLDGTSTWASAFANVEAWVRRQTVIDKPLTSRAAQTLRDPRTGSRAHALIHAELAPGSDQPALTDTNPKAA